MDKAGRRPLLLYPMIVMTLDMAVITAALSLQVTRPGTVIRCCDRHCGGDYIVHTGIVRHTHVQWNNLILRYISDILQLERLCLLVYIMNHRAVAVPMSIENSDELRCAVSVGTYVLPVVVTCV